MDKRKEMHRKLLFAMWLILSAVVLLGCDYEDLSLKITTEDFTACVGEEVQLLGKGFSIEPAENIVKFENIQAEVLSASRTELIVKIPWDASGKITVKVGSHTAQGPIFTPAPSEYYIKFKADGDLKNFSVCTPPYHAGTECMWGDIYIADQRFAFLRVCNDHDTVTPEILESWNGDQLLFSGSKPIVTFGYKENGKELHSEWAAKTGLDWPTNGSELNITSITEYPTDADQIVYTIKGNFTGFVSTGLGDEVAITEGEFNVLFTLSE